MRKGDGKLGLDGEKPPAPEVYHASLGRARKRTTGRLHGPMTQLDPETRKLVCPFGDVEPDWYWMVLDTFGTRGHPVAAVFIRQLVEFCSETWDDEKQEWMPDDQEITMILHVVSAHRPRNEAQAVLAAQIAATHMILMKVGQQAYKHPWDTRTVGAYARLAQASAVQHEAMARAKGKRPTRQTITVKRDNHVHYHVHGGGSGSGDQPHAPEAGRCIASQQGAALPGDDPGGHVVPLSRRAR